LGLWWASHGTVTVSGRVPLRNVGLFSTEEMGVAERGLTQQSAGLRLDPK
jgi:hypothetical protein